MSTSDLPLLSIRTHSGVTADASVTIARAAETHGLHTLWFAENPYERGVLPAAAACALATSRLGIAIGVFNPFNRHPTLMAMEMGALDELSGGRVLLGIGSGVPAWVNRIVTHRKPLSALRDSTIIARGLLAGEEVTHQGEMYSADGVRLGYRLVRDRVPVYLAAMADKSLQLCGELGDGLIIGNMCPPAFTRHAIEMMREGARRAGRNVPQNIVKYVPCAVDQDSAEARRRVIPAIGAMLGAYSNAYLQRPAVVESIMADSGISRERFDTCMRRLAAGTSAAEVLDDDFVAAYSLAGTAQECADQCRSLRADGVTEIAVSFIGGDVEQCMARLRAAWDR